MGRHLARDRRIELTILPSSDRPPIAIGDVAKVTSFVVRSRWRAPRGRAGGNCGTALGWSLLLQWWELLKQLIDVDW
jgi:hypothetical protein